LLEAAGTTLGREVLEQAVFAEEPELEQTGQAASLPADDDLSNALAGRILAAPSLAALARSATGS